MRKIALLFVSLLMISVLFAAPAYFANRILFSLDASEGLLTEEQMHNLKTPYPELNKLIAKYNVVKIEPWLSNATDKDRDGNVCLNRIYRLTTSADIEAPFAAAGEIAGASTAIKNSEPEAIMRTCAIPDDPSIGNQWYLYKAQVQKAWSLWNIEGGEIPGSRNIVVAVVDDGVEYTHPDLWKNIWINQDEISNVYFSLIDANADNYITAEEAVASLGTDKSLKDVLNSTMFADGVDNDGDGYIDNIIGWDTDESGSSSDDDRNPMVTNNDHGTHVAGLVGATTNNNEGIASAAYNISIMPVKATGDETVLSINTGWDGILYAAQAGADIINCSWGGPGYSSYAQNIVNNVYNNYGSMIVAAAGNGADLESGTAQDDPHYPSGYDNVVSVTAVNSQDHFSWASYGAADGNFYGVDLSAPGETMLSTVLTKAGSYGYKMGTSMASPFAASCFALLKSVYPDSSNDWLIDRMLSNTDPIDDINPSYAGQIGTGRINILKALVSDQWPSLSIKDQWESITSGDGDNVFNPGETINLMVEVKNDTGWADATNIIGVLRTKEAGVTINDSVANWSTIPQNSSAFNDGDGYSISFASDLSPGEYDFELLLENATDEGIAYSFKKDLTISISLDQDGFPFIALTEVETSPLFVDIDNNGTQEIIFGDKSGKIYTVDHAGDTLAGFPVDLGSQIGGVAVADIDRDDTLEIVATGFNKLISVYDVFGHHEWSRHTGAFITAMPAIGNIDNDPELEVVVGSYDQKIYGINHDSTDVAGFPYALGQLLRAGVALADIDDDAVDEIIYTAYGGTVGALDVVSDSINNLWSASTSGPIASEAQVLIDDDGSGMILLGNELGDMYGYDLNGSEIFMLDGEGAIKASPAIYIAPSGNIMAYFATTSGYLYKLNVSSTGGTLNESWTKKISPVFGSLVLVDLLPDDISTVPYVLAIGNDGLVYAYNENTGSPMPGFPIDTKILSKSSLAAVDLDNDGDLELINGNYSGLSVTDLKMEKGLVHWPMHRGSASRSGSMKTDKTDIIYIDPGDLGFELIDNYPNPFNPSTTIKYKVGDNSPVNLKVYSLDGKLALTRQIANPAVGINEINIDMSAYASGIYLYALEQSGKIRSSKMILLK